MTYAFVTEWMSAEQAEKFDRDIGEEPGAAARREARNNAQLLMNVFGMAGA